jgi:hypothetical protein
MAVGVTEARGRRHPLSRKLCAGIIAIMVIAAAGSAFAGPERTHVRILDWRVVLGPSGAKHVVAPGGLYRYCTPSKVRQLTAHIKLVGVRDLQVHELWSANGSARDQIRRARLRASSAVSISNSAGLRNGLWSLKIERSGEVLGRSTIRLVSKRCTGGGGAGSGSGPGKGDGGAGSSGGSSGSVPCALTHAAGADGTNSCWATHTGVQNGTGFSEAQILAGQSTLKHVVGDQVLSTAGAVVKNEWIDGCVEIAAPNVTLEDSLVHSDHQCRPADGTTAPAAISTGRQSTGALVRDVTVDAIDPGNGSDGDSRGVSLYSGGSECLRCNVFGFSKDFLLDGSSSGRTLLQDSYGHDLAHDWPTPSTQTGCPHENVIFDDSSNYVTIEHSYAIATAAGNCATGAIDDLGDYGAFGHDVVDSSYAEGGLAADMYTGRAGACGSPYTVTNNALSNDNGYNSTDTINYWTDTGNTWSGNYVPETGAAFPEPPTSSGC